MTAIPFISHANIAQLIAEILRIDHAGETAAVLIYKIQHRISKHFFPHFASELAATYAEEEPHLAFFERAIAQAHSRPTALLPLWHLLSACLATFFALFGRSGVELCTMAVEQVIVEHYSEQQALLQHLESLLAVNPNFYLNNKLNDIEHKTDETLGSQQKNRRWDSNYENFHRHKGYQQSRWRKKLHNFAKNQNMHNAAWDENENINDVARISWENITDLPRYINMLRQNIAAFNADERAHFAAARAYLTGDYLHGDQNSHGYDCGDSLAKNTSLPRAAPTDTHAQAILAMQPGTTPYSPLPKFSALALHSVQFCIKAAIKLSSKL